MSLSAVHSTCNRCGSSLGAIALFAPLFALLCGSASIARAANADLPGPLKQVTLIERNAAGNEIQSLRETTSGQESLFRVINLGRSPRHYAEGYVSSSGATFWSAVEARTNAPAIPGYDSGRGVAFTTVTYFFTKDADSASATLNLAGAWLELFDGQPAPHPRLRSYVDMSTRVYDPNNNPGENLSSWFAYAQIEGNGGSFANETFEADIEGFTFSGGLYRESTLDGFNTTGASLALSSQQVVVDISRVCTGCDFALEVVATAVADNYAFESRAFAYLRDPVHFVPGNNDPLDTDAISISFSGLTLLPAPIPEPSSFASLLAGLAVLSAVARVRRFRGQGRGPLSTHE